MKEGRGSKTDLRTRHRGAPAGRPGTGSVLEGSGSEGPLQGLLASGIAGEGASQGRGAGTHRCPVAAKEPGACWGLRTGLAPPVPA